MLHPQLILGQANRICCRKQNKDRIQQMGLDAEELCAEASKILCTAVSEGKYEPDDYTASAQEAFLTGILMNLIRSAIRTKIARGKVVRPYEHMEELSADYEMRMTEADPVENERQIDLIMAEATNPIDRAILVEFLKTPRLNRVAKTLGMKPNAVRQRFRRLKKKILQKYGTLDDLPE